MKLRNLFRRQLRQKPMPRRRFSSKKSRGVLPLYAEPLEQRVAPAVPVIPNVFINDFAGFEGDVGKTTFSFTVSLSEPTTRTVTVKYSTSDGTATAGADYGDNSGSISISAGETEKTVKIKVNGDMILEGNETFFVNLTLATNATITDGQGIGTILDDEDNTPPVLAIDAPLANGDHSFTARLIGTVTDDLSGVVSLRYTLDNGFPQFLSFDSEGEFDTAISATGLGLGSHQILVEAFDFAGNLAQETISFDVTQDFFVAPNGTHGWGGSTLPNTLILEERDSFLSQFSIPIELGQSEGSRTLSFTLTPRIDTTDTTAAIEDALLVYLRNTTDYATTLLDNGLQGTTVFSLAGDDAEYRAGQVRFNGSTVTIDLTSLASETEGTLVFQLINHDDDTGSRITITSLTNIVDAEGMTSPIFPFRDNRVDAGAALDFETLTQTQDIVVDVGNVRFDPVSGNYTAEIRVKNNGDLTGRQVAVVFNDLPAAVTLLNPSGLTLSGAPYINMREAIQSGGLLTNAVSDPIEIVFSDFGLARFALHTSVFVGPPNRAPIFEPVEPMTVFPGDELEVPLFATDPDGDRVTFIFRSEDDLPTGQFSGSGTMTFRPRPDQVGTYNFTLIATDGSLNTEQFVTLVVAADPNTTTRVSGVVMNTDGSPLDGVPVELAGFSDITDASGAFVIELPTLKVPTESFNISIPAGDPALDPFNTGTQAIPFRRAVFDVNTGTSPADPRQHPNLVSSFIDASVVYGSDPARAAALRSFVDGKLLTSPGNLLPLNAPMLENDNAGRLDPTTLFVTGDVRTNENVALIALHTLLMREHNRLADEIKTANPTFTDEEIYQQARRMVGAIIENITYNEYLPLLLGSVAIPAYSGYNPAVDPSISALFSAAAFRLGHTQLFSDFLRLDVSGQSLPGGPLPLRDAFFTVDPIHDDGIEPFLRGLAAQQAQEADAHIIDDVRNFLFGPPGSGGMDLASLNIQRGRDMGLPSYNQARIDFGLAPVTSFSQITSDTAVQAALESIYGSVDDIDVWVGGIAEDHAPGSLIGPLFQRIVADQFQRSRDGDRYWFENGQFTATELTTIRNTSLSSLIERNTDIVGLPSNVFTTGTPPAAFGSGGSAAISPMGDFRSFDGSGNNLSDLDLGSVGTDLLENFTRQYGDGISTPGGADLPGAREISNAVVAQSGSIPNTVGATGFVVFWGQILDHDLGLTPGGVSDTLKILGNQRPGIESYPFVAEKMPLMLGHTVYPGVENVITRPIYLPIIDAANAKQIDSQQDTLVTTDAIPGASVFVAAETLRDRQGNLYSGTLSITEVPTNLTPASLPENLRPDFVITVQPADLVFTTPAPLALPNTLGYAPGLQMDLWSINPITGAFDKVGVGEVSADGTVIETIEGGIRNSSWHFYALQVVGVEVKVVDLTCRTCPNPPKMAPTNPGAMLYTGTTKEGFAAPPVQSLGRPFEPNLHYDSLRADPEQVVNFTITLECTVFTSLPSDSTQMLWAKVSFTKGDLEYQLPGFDPFTEATVMEPDGDFKSTVIPSVFNKPQVEDNGDITYDAPTGESLVYHPLGGGAFDVMFDDGATILPVEDIKEWDPTLKDGYFWSLPSGGSCQSGGAPIVISASIPMDMREMPTDSYNVTVTTGILTFTEDIQQISRGEIQTAIPRTMKKVVGTTSTSSISKVHVNSRDSEFGAGWGLDGLQRIVFNEKLGKYLIIDGDGTQTLFDKSGDEFLSPEGDFSTLEKLGDGSFRRTFPDGTQYHFDADGNLLSMTDSNGNQIQYQYDNDGRLSTITDPVGQVTTLNYTGDRLTSMTDAAGRVTTFEYDAEGNLIGILFPDDSTQSWTYDQDHRLTSSTDPLGNTGKDTYDSFGRIVESTFRDGSVVQVAPVETEGLQHLDKIDGNPPESANFDPPQAPPALDHTPTEGVFADANGNVTSYVLDTKGQTVSGQDAAGPMPAYIRNEQNLITQVNDGRGHVTQYTYDERGNVLTIADELSVVSTDAPILFPDQMLPQNTGEVFNFFINRPRRLVATGDVNGDLIPDIVSLSSTFSSASGSDNFAAIFIGNGNGTFADPIHQTVGTPTTVFFALALGDMDGDADLDLLVAHNGPVVSVLLNDGAGSFGSPTSFAVANQPIDIVVGDINRDGFLDIVTADRDGSPHMLTTLLNSGSATFGSRTDYTLAHTPGDLELADMNGDLNLDVILANPGQFITSGTQSDNTVTVMLGTPSGSLGSPADFTVGRAPMSLVVADMNTDGFKDIVTANAGANSVSVLSGDGTGAFPSRTDYSVAPGPRGIVVGDVDTDGDLDVVTAGFGPMNFDFSGNYINTFIGPDASTGSVLRGDGSGGLGNRSDIFVESNASSLLARDLNADNVLDLVVSSEDFSFRESFVTPLLGNDDGTFGAQNFVQAGNFTAPVAIGDVDEDGLADLVTFEYTNTTSTLAWFKGNGDGTFGIRTDVLTGEFITNVALGDLNHDDHLDLILTSVTNSITNPVVSVLLGNGNGTFGASVNYSVGGFPLSVALDDVNGDDDLDVVTANYFGSNVSVLLGGGDGTLGSRADYSVGAGPLSVALGDVDGDNDLDIVSANLDGQSVSILFNAGAGSFGNRLDVPILIPPPHPGPGPTIGRPRSVALADFNEDGMMDIAVPDYGSFGQGHTVTTLRVLTGGPGGTFTESAHFSVGSGPIAIATADVDMDGNQDILTASYTESGVTVLRGLGDGSFEVKEDFFVGGAPQYMAVGDLDGDGDPDLVTSDFVKLGGTSTARVAARLNGTVGGGAGGLQQSPRVFTYDPVFSQLTSMTDELGRQTLFEIDPTNGNTLSITRVVGALDFPSPACAGEGQGEGDDLVTCFTYTSRGLVDTMTDPLGRVTDYDYDLLGRLTTITYAVGTPDQANRLFEYDLAGNVTATIDENGNRTEYEYDTMNRLTLVRDALLQETSYEYDPSGNLISTTDARGNITHYEYDQLDRLVKTTDALGGMTRFAYDAAGNMIAVTDPVGNVTQYIYDARNRLVTTVDAEGGTTTRRYDFDNNLVSLADPVGNTTNFAYDARARLVVETDPLGSTTSYSYDAVDNLTSKQDRNERVTSFTYDDLDRLTTETWINGGNAINYSYDKASNLLAVSDSFSSLAFSYDARDRVMTVDNAGTPNLPNVVLTYSYDDASNVISITDSLGGVTSYQYDALHRVSSIQQQGTGVSPKRVDFAYNEVSQFATISRFADLAGTQSVAITTYAYDSLNRLTNIQHLGSSNQTINFETLTYDAASRITSINSVDGLSTYNYDQTNQLLSAIHDPLSSLPNESYSYDLNGNRTINGYVTGAANRLVSDGTFNYEYDDEGNTIRSTEIATGVVREFEWDHRNRLVAVTDRDASNTVTQTVEYTYDTAHRRVSKTVTITNQTPVASYYVYDRENRILEFVDTDGIAGSQVVARALRNFNGSGVNTVLAQEDSTGDVLWLAKDRLGSTTDIVDNAGALLQHIRYDSFGNIVQLTDGSSVVVPLSSLLTTRTFTGYEYDPAIDMYNAWMRVYNGRTGRFINQDPIKLRAGDANFYRYGGNNSISRTDPTGLVPPIVPFEEALACFLYEQSAATALEAELAVAVADYEAAVVAGNAAGRIAAGRQVAAIMQALEYTEAESLIARAVILDSLSAGGGGTAVAGGAAGGSLLFMPAGEALAAAPLAAGGLCACAAAAGVGAGYAIGNVPIGGGRDVYDWLEDYIYAGFFDPGRQPGGSPTGTITPTGGGVMIDGRFYPFPGY